MVYALPTSHNSKDIFGSIYYHQSFDITTATIKLHFRIFSLKKLILSETVLKRIDVGFHCKAVLDQ